jgi:hypothetical protein
MQTLGDEADGGMLAGPCPVGSLPTGRQEEVQYKRNFLPGKPRRAYPALTGWAGSFT